MTNEEQTFEDIKTHLRTLEFNQLISVGALISQLQQVYTKDPGTVALAIAWFGACLAADKNPIKEEI